MLVHKLYCNMLKSDVYISPNCQLKKLSNYGIMYVVPIGGIKMELNDLRMYRYLQDNDMVLATQVKQIYDLTFETINNIAHSYGNFTMHDMNHGLRVANYMEMLAFGIDERFYDRMSKFSPLEVALMILSSLLHDIGMNIRDEDRINIKNNNIKYTQELTFDGVMNTVNNDENEAIKEIVRRTHADRILDFINYDFGGNKISNILIIDNNYTYAEDVVEICRAHGHNHSELTNIRTERTKGNYSYNSQYIAALLRIADYLDIDKQRTPILWYSLMNLEGFSKDEWETHFVIENNVKLKDYMEGKSQIYFDGISRNAKIHRKYLSYIDNLKIELENTNELLNTKNTAEKYKFNIVSKIDDRVETEGFTYSDLRLNLDYSSITDLLMGENIYGDKKLGVRELIQNSIDACEIMNESQTDTESLFSTKAAIYVIISKEKNYVKIKDTGIGMTLDVIKKHFLNVGKSYYKSNEYLFKNHTYKPIGQYGIGFLACFLLSDSVIVKTKYYKSHEITQIELEKSSEYVVTTSEETANFIGTEITLNYESFFEVFKTKEKLCDFLQEYFYTKIQISLVDEDEGDSIFIKNCYVDNFYLEDSKYKYDIADCSNSSENIEGKILIKEGKKNVKYEIKNIEYSCTYLYDKSSNSFVVTSNGIATSRYYMINYANISEDVYEEIRTKEKNDSRLHSAVMSLAKKDNNIIYLLIDCKDSDIVSLFSGVTDKERIKKIIENSNLPYYESLFLKYEFLSHIFVYNDKYVNLNLCMYRNVGKYQPYFDDEEFDKNNAYIYNKGILIGDYSPFFCTTPYEVNYLYGYINILNLPIQLDVSRNKIIEGKNTIEKEMNLIVLEHKKNNEKEPQYLDMLEQMISYIKNE